MQTNQRLKPQLFLYALIFFLPYLIFYLFVPFLSRYTLGNDYVMFPIQNQMYMMFSLKTGSFPLFIPGFCIGHSFAALTLGQIFHPLPHIAAALPHYWQGQALEWNTFLRLFSLGLTQSMLYAFLGRLKLRGSLSFLISFITVYNLRMLDVFRYGASLEAYTAHLMLIATIGSYFLKSRRRIRESLLIIVLTYMLVISGHPQMMYYGLMGTGLFVLIIPFYAAVMLPDQHVDIKRTVGFWCKAGALLGGGILLASAYILPYYFDFILTNSARVGREYVWANVYLDTWIGSWGNFFGPLITNGAGSFGASSLISLVLVLPLLRLCRIRIPKTIWSIWGLMLIVFLCMQGGRTPLYSFFWKYVPLAGNFRGPGRISFVMPMLIMLLLAWIVNVHKLTGQKIKIPPLKILALTALLITVLFNGFIYPQLDIAPEAISNSAIKSSLFMFGLQDPFLSQSDMMLIFLLTAWIGIILLFLLGLLDFSSSSSSKILGLICLLTVLQVLIVLRHGTYYRVKKTILTFEQILKQNRIELAYPYYPGFGLSSAPVAFHKKRFFSEPYLAKIYKRIIPVTSREQAYEYMTNEMTPQTIHVEDAQRTLNESLFQQNVQEEGGRIQLKYSSFNRLQLSANTPSPAFFGLAYPYSNYWNAWVNGQKAKTYRINGLYLGLELPQGQSEIEFRYFSPPAFWGMVLSCAAMFLIGAVFCFHSFAGCPRVIGLLCVAVMSMGTFKAWQGSLYSGENIKTDYQWAYTPSSGKVNNAYGKMITVNASFPEFHSMSMVDGDRRPNSGFVSKFHKEPTAILDLQRTTLITEVILYESGNRPADTPNVFQLGLFIDQISRYINTRPMEIDISEDGQHWQTVSTIPQPKQPGQPIVLTFEEPHQARYIRIKAQKGAIGFDEVDVH